MEEDNGASFYDDDDDDEDTLGEQDQIHPHPGHHRRSSLSGAGSSFGRTPSERRRRISPTVITGQPEPSVLVSGTGAATGRLLGDDLEEAAAAAARDRKSSRTSEGSSIRFLHPGTGGNPFTDPGSGRQSIVDMKGTLFKSFVVFCT